MFKLLFGKEKDVIKEPVPLEVLIDLYNEGIISKEELEEASGLTEEEVFD